MTRAYRKSPALQAKRQAIAAEMFALHKGGVTIREIARQYGVMPNAIVYRLKAWGHPTFGPCDPQGGFGRALADKRTARSAAIEARALKKWGCTYAQYLEIQALRKPTLAFTRQRRNARERGIEWQFNLWQWWTVWQESGHWEHRGRGQGYVMCRYGDIGPYAVDNVFIAPAIENSSEKAIKQSGLPIGVSLRKDSFRVYRMIDGKKHYLGTYGTPSRAHAAYLSLGPIGCEPLANNSARPA